MPLYRYRYRYNFKQYMHAQQQQKLWAFFFLSSLSMALSVIHHCYVDCLLQSTVLVELYNTANTHNFHLTTNLNTHTHTHTHVSSTYSSQPAADSATVSVYYTKCIHISIKHTLQMYWYSTSVWPSVYTHTHAWAHTDIHIFLSFSNRPVDYSAKPKVLWV